MTELEQNRAIAEACGFEDISESYGAWVGVKRSATNRMAMVLPDYLHDLNAMHEAEKTLNLKHVQEYNEQLSKLTVKLNDIFNKAGPNGWIFHATAAQRAEAFLRTIGKWKETP